MFSPILTSYRSLPTITKCDKDFAEKLDFKDIKSPIKVRDIHKIEKKNSISISVFGYQIKEKHPIYVSKIRCEEKDVDLLLVEEKGKINYVLIKDFNRFIYKHIYTVEKTFLLLLFTSF